jgi:preprotein translocase subunit SecE
MAGKLRGFLQSIQTEAKKITWPSRGEVLRSTLIVIVSIIALAVFIGVIDIFFLQIIRLLVG